MSGDIAPARLALLLGLSFFFGLAFEEFYAKAARRRAASWRRFSRADGWKARRAALSDR
jgi:hypothetical protein